MHCVSRQLKTRNKLSNIFITRISFKHYLSDNFVEGRLYVSKLDTNRHVIVVRIHLGTFDSVVGKDTSTIALHGALVIMNGVASMIDSTGTHPLMVVFGRRGPKINDSVIFKRAWLPFSLEKIDKQGAPEGKWLLYIESHFGKERVPDARQLVWR